ncbi:MAG: type II secretion system protein [Phycisphaerae bacterium]|nr:type II secretion system protein [Phycisphaerae bacterium]
MRCLSSLLERPCLDGIRGRCPARRAFTVIELLIVVSIIITLAVMLVATWPMVKERMVLLHCRTNLSKCHKIMCEYGANNSGFLPSVTGSSSNSWNNFYKGGKGSKNYVVEELKDYGASADIFMCPAWVDYDNPNSSYRRGWDNPTEISTYTAGYNPIRFS